ncbi:TOBE domain-containing protein [Streptomyces sp. NPDC005568]|uniref:TOBE domain-containing protein n=1 Tax=Streptomyces sp. NPDC005568 TaxID=3156887 RepID=UPI0033A7DC06
MRVGRQAVIELEPDLRGAVDEEEFFPVGGRALHRDAKSGAEEEGASLTSVRNAFPGIVTAVKLGDVAAQVEIQAGPHRLVSLLTREAVEELGLEVGMEATARVKSTSVHIDRT